MLASWGPRRLTGCLSRFSLLSQAAKSIASMSKPSARTRGRSATLRSYDPDSTCRPPTVWDALFKCVRAGMRTG